MTARPVSRRAFLALGAGGALALGGRRRAGAAEAVEGTVVWQDLGPRSEDSSTRAWFAVPRRARDGSAYIYSGTTNGTNHLLRWDREREWWVIHKKGNASDRTDRGLWFPKPGAEFPAAVDNGYAVWDNVNDELWVNCVNPSRYAPAIYSPATDKWRQVTPEEFPSYNFRELMQLFNSGCASNARYMVLYGGDRSGLKANLHVYDGQTRTWQYFADHGLGDHGPGRLRNIQGQLQWVEALDAFLLYARQKVYLLSLDWKWREQPVTGDPPEDPLFINVVTFPGRRAAVAVVNGPTPNIRLLDVEKWRWRVFAPRDLAPPIPRRNGAAWAEGRSIYVCWGSLRGVGHVPGTGKHVFAARDLPV